MCEEGDVGVPLSIRNVHLAIVVIFRRLRQLPVSIFDTTERVNVVAFFDDATSCS